MQDNTSFLLSQEKTFTHLILPPSECRFLIETRPISTHCTALDVLLEHYLKHIPNKRAMVPKYFSLPSLTSLASIMYTSVEVIPQKLGLQNPHTTAHIVDNNV